MTDCTALVISGPTGPTGNSGATGMEGPTGSAAPSGSLVYGGSVSVAGYGGSAPITWPTFPTALDSFVAYDANGGVPVADSIGPSGATLHNSYGTTQTFFWIAVGH
jgi:hypothetical protein